MPSGLGFRGEARYGKALCVSETNFTLDGAGVTLNAGSDSNLFLESRYLSVQTSGGSTKFIPITLGFSFGTR